MNKFKLSVLIYFFALFLRLLMINKVGIYSDEITWMVRGKEVVYAIIHRNINYFDNAWWNKKNDTEAIGLPLVVSSGISYATLAGSSKFSLGLLDDITAARLPLVMINSFLPVAIFLFGSIFLSTGVGLMAALIYSINPVAIGLDRWIVHDSFLTLFSFISLASFFTSAEKKKMSLWPGIFMALAFLTKPNGILVITGWILFYFINYRSKKIFQLLFINILVFFGVITLLWPASWRQPITAFFEYLYRQTQLVQNGMRNFYLGQVTNDPGWSYYIFQFITKLPEVVIIGIVASLFSGIRKNKTGRLDILVSVLIYCVIFFIFISMSPKKLGIRYALPLLPWMVLLAAWGINEIYKSIKNKSLQIIVGSLMIGLLIFPLFFGPDYYQYYNSLIGGPKGAQKHDLVGFCASSRPAFEHLNSIDFKGVVYVAGCSDPVLYYSPQITVTKNFREAELIVVETYLRNQHPEDPVWNYLQDETPIKSFVNNGAVMSEIYK